MKKIMLITFILLILAMPVYLFAQIEGNFAGLNFIYPSAKLNSDDITESGYGAELLYYSFIAKKWSIVINTGFAYLHYVVDSRDLFNNPLEGKTTYVDYTKNISFYSVKLGFSLHYVFLLTEDFFRSSNTFLKNTFPYIGTGFYSTFPYRKLICDYNEQDLDEAERSFIEDKEATSWLPAVATIPFIFGINFKISRNILLNTGASYSILIYDQFTEVNGYNNMFSIYFGFLYKI